MQAGAIRVAGGVEGAGVATLCAALAFACTTQGAFWTDSRGLLLAGVVGFGLAVVRPWRTSLATAPTAGAAALAASALLSGFANGRGGAGAAQAALFVAVAVTVALARQLDAAARAELCRGLAWLGAAVGMVGWLAVVARQEPFALVDQGLWRSATTLTYANAAAALLVPLLLVALARSQTSALLRWALLVGVGATQSRGGAFALAAGLVALALLRGLRPTVVAAAPAVAGAVVTMAATLPGTVAAAAPQRWLAVAGLAAGAAVTVAASRLSPRAMFAVAAAGCVGAAVAVSSVPAVAGVRASLASQDRIDETVAAIRVLQDRPLLGAGAGVLFFYEAGDERGRAVARFAHNEYLQLGAEQGVVGLGVLTITAVAVARQIRRARRSEVWAGAVAGLVAFAAHSTLDFLWHIPALALLAAVLVGLALPNAAVQREETQ